MEYTLTKEYKYYITQCLNIDVSSFGLTIDKALQILLKQLNYILIRIN
jgi:hypothetical protein